MQTINRHSIEKKLLEATDINKEIKNIKQLLLKVGYKDYSSNTKLIYVKTNVSGGSDTINIDLKKYITYNSLINNNKNIIIDFNKSSIEYNHNGFNKNGLHKDTGSKYDPDGFDKSGYDRDYNTRNEVKNRFKHPEYESKVESSQYKIDQNSSNNLDSNEKSITKKSIIFSSALTIVVLLLISFSQSKPPEALFGGLFFIFIVLFGIAYSYLWLINKSTEAKEEEEYNAKNGIAPKILSPGQNAIKFFIGGIGKIIGLVVIVLIFSQGQGLPMVMFGLPGALIILTIIVWIYHIIVQSKTVKVTSDITKNTVNNMMKPKAKDTKDSVEAISNAHFLLNSGAITQAEFDKIKKDLLG